MQFPKRGASLSTFDMLAARRKRDQPMSIADARDRVVGTDASILPPARLDACFGGASQTAGPGGSGSVSRCTASSVPASARSTQKMNVSWTYAYESNVTIATA